MKKMILDVDGTLWDTTAVVADAWKEALRAVEGLSEAQTSQIAARVTADRLKQEFGKPMDRIADSLFPELNASQRQSLLEACCVYEHRALEAYGACEALLYEGVKETVQALAQQTEVYIVSNCQCGYIELFLQKNGLSQCVRDFECFGNTGKCKGENIRLLMARNGIEPEDAYYVGDTQGDADAAAEAGLPFVYAAYGFGRPQAYAHAIDRFGALLQL